MNNNFKMVAKTMFGFEEILAKELRNLGAGNVEEGVRSVFLRAIRVLCTRQTFVCGLQLKS